MTDRKSESVSGKHTKNCTQPCIVCAPPSIADAPWVCSKPGCESTIIHGHAIGPPPTAEAPPEWCREVARVIDRSTYETEADFARLIHTAYTASEEARKVEADAGAFATLQVNFDKTWDRAERLEKALRDITKAPCITELLGDDVDDCGCPKCRAVAALASPLVEETR